MKFLARILIAVLAALWLAAPATSGGGENGGGTGVWILPMGCPLGPPLTMGATAGGATRQLPGFDNDLKMVVDSQLGSVTATVTDPVSGIVIPLSVSGRDVILTRDTMRAYRDANVSHAQILIANHSHRGYLIDFQIAPGGQTATLTVR